MRQLGYTKLGAFIKLQAIGEMGHAEQFIERILFLEGVPGMGELQPLNVGQNVKEQLTNDLQLEYEAVGILNTAIKDSVAASDNASRELFERVLKDEEEHVDWLESQLQMIDDMGLGIYLSQQLADEAPAAASQRPLPRAGLAEGSTAPSPCCRPAVPQARSGSCRASSRPSCRS